MTNLDSAWQASVVQLAQQGNLKAITFWLNRYLVPQGMCAQLIPQQPGLLLIRIVCHRLPDGDRLIHFIRQRFIELNSDLIQVLRITAQMVGSPDLLWEQAVPVRFAPQATQPVSPSPSPVPQPAKQTAPPPNPTQPAAPQIQFASRPIPRSAPAAGSPIRRKKVRRYKLRAGSPIAKLRVQFYVWSDATLDRLFELKANTVRATRRSRRWFNARPLEVRALLLGGSAVTAIATVCGIQVLSQYLGSNPGQGNGGLWSAMLTAETPKPPIDQAGTVTAALEQVPVIRKTVANPTDPAITLVFGSNGAIGGTQSVPTFQQADLLITNLDNAPADNLSLPKGAIDPSPSAAASPTSATKQAIGKTSLPPAEPAESDASPAATDRASATDSASMLVSSASFLSSPADPTEAADLTVPPESRKATIAELLANGVDVVNVASNSLIASGKLEPTLDSLSQKAIYPVGAGQTPQAARHPQIFEVKGQKIALLGYSDADVEAAAQTPSANASLSSQNLSSQNLSSQNLSSQVEADIKAIRSQVNWVIVSYHWNKALRAYPADSQLSLSRTAIDHGADLVVGYAPQLTQGAEIYQGRAIVYSLGDAIEEIDSAGIKNTAVLKVTLLNKQMQLDLLPVQVQQNQPALVEGEAATRINSYLQQASSLFDHPLRSPVALDSQLHLSLPVAPDSQLPTEPFLSDPKPDSSPSPR